MLAKKRPDIEIVGDDLHPLGKVKDFSPYIAKIKASGADTVITGNWGNDLSLLVKAGKEAGSTWTTTRTTPASGACPSASAMPASVTSSKSPSGTPTSAARARAAHVLEYRKRFPDARTTIYYSAISARHRRCSRKAIDQAKSDRSGQGRARAGRHEVSKATAAKSRCAPTTTSCKQPLYISTLVKADAKDVKFDIDEDGLGFRTDARIDGKDTVHADDVQDAAPVKAVTGDR